MGDFFAELGRRHIYRIGVGRPAIAALIALTCFLEITSSAVSADRLPNSIAVLPFENVSPDPDNAYFATGIHDTLLNELAKISDINVISHTSVLRYADGQTPFRQIAAELNVETVMEGTVQYADNQVRITAQLIDSETGAHLWSENYDRDFSGIFAIQTEIASNIAMALEAEVLPADRESIERPPTNSPDAYAAYLKAIAVIQSGFDVSASSGTLYVVQSYLDEALELDPEFALAYAWKARIFYLSRINDPVTEENWLGFKSEMDRLALEYASRALTLDPNIGLAHTVRSDVHLANWRAGPAQEEADEALRLSPKDPNVLGLYAAIETYIQDNFVEGVRYWERAVELDPNNDQKYDDLGATLVRAKRYDEASEALQECLDLRPLDSACNRRLAAAEIGRGNRDVALDVLRRLESQYQDTGVATLAIMAHGFGVLGQLDSAQRAFERLRERATIRYVDPVIWAEAYMGVGDYDEALGLLNAAAENPDLIQTPYMPLNMRINFWSDPMLEQPEFAEVRRRLRPRE